MRCKSKTWVVLVLLVLCIALAIAVICGRARLVSERERELASWLRLLDDDLAADLCDEEWTSVGGSLCQVRQDHVPKAVGMLAEVPVVPLSEDQVRELAVGLPKKAGPGAFYLVRCVQRRDEPQPIVAEFCRAKGILDVRVMSVVPLRDARKLPVILLLEGQPREVYVDYRYGVESPRG